MKKIKIAILGDSISQGIGKKKVNYISSLKKKLGDRYEICNFAHTGTTINYALDNLEKVKEFEPNIIIIMYGNVDAQLRPNINGDKYNIGKFIPKRYKNNGMLDPRPFYSKKWYRIVPDRIDNIIRLIIRNIISKTEGMCQWIDINEFDLKYREFISNFDRNNTKCLLISTIKLDERYYPGCTEQYKKFNICIQKIAKDFNHQYIDLFSYIEKKLKVYEWNDIFYYDHYHPNSNGYEIIAGLLSNYILDININYRSE